jgi:hypothetical protein
MSPKRRSKHVRLLDAIRPYYDVLLAEQGGVCAICKRQPSINRRLDIDHDHRTMLYRGLLCHRCNRALPVWIDVAWLKAAIIYLERRPTSLAQEIMSSLPTEFLGGPDRPEGQ